MRFNENEFLQLKEKIENRIKIYNLEIDILKHIVIKKKKDGTEYKNLLMAINKEELEKIALDSGCQWFSFTREDDGFYKIDFQVKGKPYSSTFYINGLTVMEIIEDISRLINLRVNFVNREEIKLSQLGTLKEITKDFVKNLEDNLKNKYESFNNLSFSIKEITDLITY